MTEPWSARIILSIPHAGTRTAMNLFGCGYEHVFIREDPRFGGFLPECKLISPLRDPRAIWRSWVKRWNNKAGEVSLDLFELQFRHLECFDREYDIFYFPIENCERTGHMVGSCETDHPEPDWDYIYNLPFVKRFYGT